MHWLNFRITINRISSSMSTVFCPDVQAHAVNKNPNKSILSADSCLHIILSHNLFKIVGYKSNVNLKTAKNKTHLKMSSAEVVCCKELPNIADELGIEANSVDPEHSYRSSLIWVHTVCHRGFLNISADEKSRRLLLRLAH